MFEKYKELIAKYEEETQGMTDAEKRAYIKETYGFGISPGKFLRRKLLDSLIIIILLYITYSIFLQ